MKRIIRMSGTACFQRSHGHLEVTDLVNYPDGEFALGFDPPIGPDDEILLIGSCHSAAASEALLAAAYEIASEGPASLEVLNVYFRSARSDRKVQHFGSMAKFQARLWSGVGQVYPGVRLTFLDLHNDQILSYFSGPVHVRHLSVFYPLAKSAFRGVWTLPDNCVFATVDHGRVHAVKPLTQRFGVGLAHIEKQRISGTKTMVKEVHGDVNGKVVAIFDDMIATGGSLVGAALAYKERGAQQVYAVAVHGLFLQDAISKLREAGISGVLVTDSHPNAVAAVETDPTFVKVSPLGAMLGLNFPCVVRSAE